jgi:YD repeat-containing protein
VGGSLAAVTLPANVAGGTSTTYNVDNEQSSFNGTSLTYDSDGNLTGDGTNIYTWDGRRHLTQIAQGGTTTASFQYDAFGRRSQKTIGSLSTQFLYDGLNPVQELQSGSPIANMMTGLRTDEFFTRTDSTETVAFLADALGSTIGLVGSPGSIATSYMYQPFGATTAGGTSNGNTSSPAARTTATGCISIGPVITALPISALCHRIQ